MRRRDGATPLGAAGHRLSTSPLLPYTPTPNPEGGGQRNEPLYSDDGVKQLDSEAGMQEERLMALEEVPYTPEPNPDTRNPNPYNPHLKLDTRNQKLKPHAPNLRPEPPPPPKNN